mgnify:CR=1 FL=1
MKKRTRSLGLVGVGLMVAACSGGDGEPAPLPTMAETEAGLAKKLDSLTGATWWMEPGVAGNAALYYARGEGRPVLPNAQRSPTDIIALLTPFASDLGLGSDPSRELGEPETLLDASDEDVGTYRFRQHLPGTSIPVFDAALVVAVTKEGSLEYLSTGHARNLGTLGARPTLDGHDATHRALVETMKVPPEDRFQVLTGHEPTVPIPDFEDAYKTQRVLEAVMISAAERRPVPLDEVQ